MKVLLLVIPAEQLCGQYLGSALPKSRATALNHYITLPKMVLSSCEQGEANATS